MARAMWERYQDMVDRLRKDARKWERNDEAGVADDLYGAAAALQRAAEYLYDGDQGRPTGDVSATA